MSAIRRSVVGVAVAALLTLATAPAAIGQEDVAALIEFVRQKPANMDRDTWREERRDAAKKLGDSGDKQAVPVLIEIVETEEFDAIAEIAVKGLGNLGDDRAVPALSKVADDRSRDRHVRNLAETALKKLGAKSDSGDSAELAASGGISDSSIVVGGGTSKTITPPAFPEDTIAAAERLTFVLGGASLTYDTVRDNPVFRGVGTARYDRVSERPEMAVRYGLEGGALAGLIDYDGDDSTARALTLNAKGDGDVRFYLGESRQFFASVSGALGSGFAANRLDRPGPDNDTKEYHFALDASVALWVGYGRSFDVGEALRLRRIELVLEQAKALGRPVSGDLAEKVLATWWALRREIGAHARLVATVKILRESGVLLGEPDAGLSYRLLEVLRDGQLDHRIEGWDVRMGIGEVYTMRDDQLDVDEGRSEHALISARYGVQAKSGSQELVGEAAGRYRILAPDGELAPFALGASATYRRFRYGDNFDPLGAYEISGDVIVSDTDLDRNLAVRVGGLLGWRWKPNRASEFRLAGTIALESNELFFGVVFDAAYGWLDSSFVGRGTYDALKR